MVENPNYYAIIPANVRYDKRLALGARLLYGELTALSGKEGFCWASNGYFANLYDTSDRTIRNWISALRDCGYIYTELEQEQHRRIYIASQTGWVEGTRKKSSGGPEKNFQGVGKNLPGGPEKNFHHNNTSNITTMNEKKNTTSSKLDSEFESLWKLYPKKQGKEGARKAYLKAMKEKAATFEEVQDGINRYLEYIRRNRTEPRFVKQGSTWFNQRCWNDDYGVEVVIEQPFEQGYW